MTQEKLIPIALVAAILFGAIIAYICYAAFDMALETALVVGVAVGVADFLMVKYLLSLMKPSSHDDDDRIG